MYKYIKNPVNNKKVNIHSKLGKNIVRQYLNLFVGGADIRIISRDACGVGPSGKCNFKYRNEDCMLIQRRGANPQCVKVNGDVGREALAAEAAAAAHALVPAPKKATPKKAAPLPSPHPRNEAQPDNMADLYDLHKDQPEIEKRKDKFTFNKRPGDHNCIGTDYDEEENCLVDPVMGECIKKDDILQYNDGQCDSKERACEAFRRYGYRRNPKTNLEEDDDFWLTHCPPPPVLFDQLDDVTIRVAVERYRNDTASCPPIETWDVSRVTDMSSLFEDQGQDEDSNDFEDFNDNITHWNTSRVTNMSYMFSGATNFNQPLQWDTKNVQDMSGMFREAESFNQPLNFDTGNVTNMSEMFCVAESFNQPLNFDTINVTNMSEMFSFAESFNQPLNFDTSNVTNMSEMFITATSFNQPLNFNTRNVEDMSSMFLMARSFNQPLEWNTQNVTNMISMFYNATNFNQSLNFNTQNVTNMDYMFEGSSGRLN